MCFLTLHLVFGNSHFPIFDSKKESFMQTCKISYWRDQKVTSSNWISFIQVQYWKNDLAEEMALVNDDIPFYSDSIKFFK